MTAFQRVRTITIAKDGEFRGHSQFDMGNVGEETLGSIEPGTGSFHGHSRLTC